jgi:copper type II ascorbate-dependent monooxygenase-like protein
MKQPDETEAEFVIPANAKAHVEDMSWTFNLPESADIRVYAMGTHMHYVGRDMRVRLEHVADPGTGKVECLIETPQWNFNWQRGYGYDAAYDELPAIKSGDKLDMHCVYDNTMDNTFVAQALRERGLDSPVEVKLGEDTLDEMCVAALGVIYPNTN